ncbi:MAG: sigma-54 dependent transcriptional regulator [bacterium]
MSILSMFDFPNPINIICVTKSTELLQRLKRLFPEDSVNVYREKNIDRVLERFENRTYEILVITGAAVEAGEIDGIEMLEVISTKSPSTQIIFLIHPEEIRLAISALKAGTFQYAKTPISDQELRLLIETAMEKRPEYGPSVLLRREIKTEIKFEKLIGRSQSMHNVYRQIRQSAATDIPVLITGDTGTGKDLVAQAIHHQSDRSEGPFIPVHLGALPQELVASELFGHEKGAFTGAMEKRIGRFELARKGTVLLDEISTIDEKVQVSLLRLIEQKEFYRIGGQRAIKTDIRLIAASNDDLGEAVRRKIFREDLLFRLDVFHIVIPPLKDRHGDIPLLMDEFLRRYNKEFQKNILGISPECVTLLESYNWPGNVRELKNVIQRAVLVCTGEVLLPEHLPPRFRPDHPVRPKVIFRVGTPLAEIEKEMVIRALDVAKNNRKRAAELLGISRRSLYNKLRKHGIK